MSIIISILAFGFIVAFHEFGHFVAARAMGAGVLEFTLGLGPAIIKKRYGQTDFSIRAFPFGGACIMLSEDEEETVSDDGLIHKDVRTFDKSQCLSALKPLKRFVIISAGPVFNFILAFVLSVFITSYAGYDRPYLVGVEEGMPAAQAGLAEGDVIIKAGVSGDVSDVRISRDFSLFLLKHQDDISSGRPVSLTVKRGNELLSYEMTPLPDKTGSRRLGISFNAAYEKPDGIGDCIFYSFYELGFSVRSTLSSLGMLLSGNTGENDIMGPIGIVAVMDESVSEASDYSLMAAVFTLFDIMMVISISLGVMNLLPVPALDGGRLVFIIAEMISGHRLSQKAEGLIHGAGIAFLFLLMIYIMFKDVLRLVLQR